MPVVIEEECDKLLLLIDVLVGPFALLFSFQFLVITLFVVHFHRHYFLYLLIFFIFFTFSFHDVMYDVSMTTCFKVAE